jgi:hypothetical protein
MITKKMKLIGSIAVIALLVLTVPALNARAAQQKDRGSNSKVEWLTIGKTGDVHFTVPVKAGDVVLQPGMYQVQHAVEGGDHFITFKEVAMPGGYRHNNNPVAKEATARIKCRIEAVDEKIKKTAVSLRTNAAGEKEVAEVDIAGERFKHFD